MKLSSQPVRVSAGYRPVLVLVILSGAPFLASLDLFVVNVAFANIGAGFPGHSLAELSWVLNGYAIVYAALLIPVGRWADRIGHKRVFLLGLVLFILASAASAASPGLWELVAFRLVQAFGAAALTPTSLGLLIHSMPAARRAFSVRIWAAMGAVASALGPVVGGLLVELSWRWVFVINVPLGVILILLALRAIPDHRAVDANPELDFVGAVLLTLGIGALATGIVQGPGWGWSSTGVIVSFALAAAALAGFTVNNARHRSPLIAPLLLRVHTFAWSNAAALLFSATFAAGLLALVLWLQNVWGYSAIWTGFALAPGPLMVPLFAIGGQKLTKHIPPGVLALAGSLLWTTGAALILLSVNAKPNYPADVLPGWLISGIGVGLALPTILSSATAQLPPARSATGSAIVNMTRQVGTVLGISLLVALLGNPVGYEAVHSAFQSGWWAVIVIGLLSAAASLGLSPRKPATTQAHRSGNR